MVYPQVSPMRQVPRVVEARHLPTVTGVSPGLESRWSGSKDRPRATLTAQGYLAGKGISMPNSPLALGSQHTHTQQPRAGFPCENSEQRLRLWLPSADLAQAALACAPAWIDLSTPPPAGAKAEGDQGTHSRAQGLLLPGFLAWSHPGVGSPGAWGPVYWPPGHPSLLRLAGPG